jgi:hypothetical protein
VDRTILIAYTDSVKCLVVSLWIKIQRLPAKREKELTGLGFRRWFSVRAALEGDASDVAGVPGDDGDQDEGRWSEEKMIPLSSCSIASRRAAEGRLETIPGFGRFG